MTPEKRNKINGVPNRSAKKAAETRKIEGNYPDKKEEEQKAVKTGEQENSVKVMLINDSEGVISLSQETAKIAVIESGAVNKKAEAVNIVKVEDSSTSV